MSNFITLDRVSLAFGLHALLDQVKMQVLSGERVCLIGRNGAGKSSLLKIIEGSVLPDSGTVWRKPALRIARVAQELPQCFQQTIYEFVAEGLSATGKLLADYYSATHELSHHHTEVNLNKLQDLQNKIDAINGWHYEKEIKTILTKLELNPDRKIAEYSGGWQRRAVFARALVMGPELLLLDEPTNHLDIAAIEWLERVLMESKLAVVFITHDRTFLERVATRIVELDRGQLTSWPGDYQFFLQHKAALLHAEEKQNADFDKKLAQEEKWIRQGIKARRTRNEGRVRALEAMRLAQSKRREVENKVSFNSNDAEQSGQLVVEAQHISWAVNGQNIVHDFSLRIMRGDRIGLIGPNGIGKTTLLNLLLGKIAPQQGTVKIGTNLAIAYFDQLRQSLDFEKTVKDNIIEGCDTIEINGQKKHIMSYLSDFLFTPLRALTPVKALSGGECNRLLLARLFSQPSNLLVMDEPTNDLDIETLELLEEMLSAYRGTVLLVSHDRKFLDHVVTSVLVFHGNGRIQEYIGGYQDWAVQNKMNHSTENQISKLEDKVERKPREKQQKLSYKEQQELKELPARIEKLEAALVAQQELTTSPEFYKKSAGTIAAEMAKLKKLNADLDFAFLRWEELEQKSILTR